MSEGGKRHKGSKKEVRPLSSGTSHKQMGKAESRSRAAQQSHNLSMYEKIGGDRAQDSPSVDFQDKLLSHHLKPMQQKANQNQSFDSIQVPNQFGQGQLGAKMNSRPVPENKLVASAQNSLIGSQVGHPPGVHQSSARQIVNQTANMQVPAGVQNPQAYDELKKRLLSEYKKLVSSKKGSAPGPVEEIRDHGRNI